MDVLIKCQGCDKVMTEKQVIPLENVPDLLQRIAPGEVVPFGECPDPDCGALCHKIEETPESLAQKLAPYLMPKLLEDLDDEIAEKVQFHADNNMVLDYDEITAEVAQRADGYRNVSIDEMAMEVATRLQIKALVPTATFPED
jgi:hypothetical protein